MTIRSVLRERLTAAMKAKNEIEKNILRLVLGEVNTIDARSGGCGTLHADDQRTFGVIRKIAENNKETLAALKATQFKEWLSSLGDISTTTVQEIAWEAWQAALSRKVDPREETLTAENKYLEGLLPSMLPAAEIIVHLDDVINDIKGAKNQGQGVGVAMKHLKGKGISNVSGTDVAIAVEQLRQ